ncbi:MAG: hypothetical protein M3177_04305 [Pseudomonadota bacterium]|nr:hypothetical protein [Pseudomonadota bacterium]
MQILESSMLGLRTARTVFRSPRSAVSVTLYPMVHVGDRRFYEETYREAFAHDVVLVEGVRSPVSRNLTRSYRWIDFEKLGLVQQPKYPPQEAVAARIVRADLTAEEFHREWRKVALLLRAAFLFGAPLYGLYRRLFSSRQSLARNMCLEDRRSAEEVLNWSPRFEPVYRSILHARDERLVQCMAAELDCASEKRVAIVYGARHMRAVLRELTRRGFHCSQSTWRTIFSL